ncbi:unnamed protein product [Jaminaea pallidilutea]
MLSSLYLSVVTAVILSAARAAAGPVQVRNAQAKSSCIYGPANLDVKFTYPSSAHLISQSAAGRAVACFEPTYADIAAVLSCPSGPVTCDFFFSLTEGNIINYKSGDGTCYFGGDEGAAIGPGTNPYANNNVAYVDGYIACAAGRKH